MLEFGYSKWRKLDNAALAFMAVAGEDDTRVFRFYCQLKEKVDGELLQEALDITMKKYPLFQAVLRKGFFWFYFERRNIRAIAKTEQRAPCSRLYIPDKKSLLFDVTYYNNRINFEVFHALTDGTGAMHFLQELVKNYLRLSHPEAELPGFEEDMTVTGKDQEEDSFSQYYSSKKPRSKERKQAAVQLKGEKLPQDEMHITELILPVKETLAKARSYGVSITILITAMLLYAIHEEIPRNRLHKPITLMIPVNLRNYFPSRSMANFFGWIEAGYVFQEETSFEEVLEHVKKEFEQELMKEQLASRMNELVSLEKNPLLRAVPLEIKQLCVRAGANFGGRSITGVYSNVGVIKMPAQYDAYIERFGLFACTEALQVCSCSYGNELAIGFTSRIPNDSIQRNFLRLLKEQELPCREEKNDFPGHKEMEKESGKKAFQVFSFVCIVAAVLCFMLNYSLEKGFSWAWLTAAGALSSWTIAAMAYKKRRNLLKNEMWQLILVSVICILWDVFTGWRCWSVDFVLPFAAFLVLCSMPAIAKVQHLQREEYLFYIGQASVSGCIPGILVAAGIVRIPYPSVICSGISLLSLIGLFIFCRKDMINELHKKFRM